MLRWLHPAILRGAGASLPLMLVLGLLGQLLLEGHRVGVRGSFALTLHLLHHLLHHLHLLHEALAEVRHYRRSCRRRGHRNGRRHGCRRHPVGKAATGTRTASTAGRAPTDWWWNYDTVGTASATFANAGKGRMWHPGNSWRS